MEKKPQTNTTTNSPSRHNITDKKNQDWKRQNKGFYLLKSTLFRNSSGSPHAHKKEKVKPTKLCSAFFFFLKKKPPENQNTAQDRLWSSNTPITLKPHRVQ